MRNTLKKYVFLTILLFASAMVFASPTPGWLEGSWVDEDGVVYEFEIINKGNEGIVNISKDGSLIDYWGWRYLGGLNYHFKRYWDRYETFTLTPRNNNSFLMVAAADVNTVWIMTRVGDQLPEREESLY